jgi:hypothetical protein
VEGKKTPRPSTSARETRSPPSARAEMDFGIGIAGRQEAASFLHTFRGEYINLCIANELAANHFLN